MTRRIDEDPGPTTEAVLLDSAPVGGSVPEGGVPEANGTSVLVVDDEPLVTRALVRRFRARGYAATACNSGQSAVEQLGKLQPQVVVTDLVMPDVDGVVLCRAASSLSRRPVVVLMSGYAEVKHRIRAFEAGAHDFMLKPLDFDELLCRIRVHLRGRRPRRRVLTFRNVTLDLESGLVTVDGVAVDIPRAPVAVLACLLAKPGRVFSFDELLNVTESTGDDRVVRKHVEKLRRALGATARMIVTVRGVGYCLGVPSMAR